jgi:hypothetical protein
MAVTTIKDRIDALVAERGSMRALSQWLDIDLGYLSRLRNEKKTNPGPYTLAALGLQSVTRYYDIADDIPESVKGK